MWFDHHRGAMLLASSNYNPTVHAILCRDGARNWVHLAATAGLQQPGCYDRRHNRFLSKTRTGIEILSDTHPAVFLAHAPGSTPASQYTLHLTSPWSRAWLNQTLSVEAATPSGSALLAMGFTDQTWMSSGLPIDLTSFGLTGCNLNIAPEATLLGTNTGAGNPVTFTLPIPNAPGLLGVAFWQQAFPIAPGANPAGMLASDSVRATVGLYR
jgi:hypothetical protein